MQRCNLKNNDSHGKSEKKCILINDGDQSVFGNAIRKMIPDFILFFHLIVSSDALNATNAHNQTQQFQMARLSRNLYT